MRIFDIPVTIPSCSIASMPSCYFMETDGMNTMTRLWAVLILCVLALTLNIFAVVKDLYVLPENKAQETGGPAFNPRYRPDRYSTLAGYPVARVASTPPGRRY